MQVHTGNPMRIVYIVSQFPNLTETFIAREITEIMCTGSKVIICTLRPIPQKDRPLGLEVKGAQTLRVPLNILTLFIAQIRALVIFPADYIRFWGEVIVAGFQKPKRFFHLIYLLAESAWLARQLDSYDIQYIHAHFLHSEAVVARWLGIMLRIPYGITTHTSNILLAQDLVRRVMIEAQVRVGDTTQTLNVYEKVSGLSGKLIRNGINLDAFPIHQLPKGSCDNQSRTILATGTLLPPKGFHVLIKACALLHDQGLSFRCRIIGEGPERQRLEELILLNGLQNQIELPGAFPFNTLIEEYKKAAVFVMPSVMTPSGSDGLPTVLIEAMATGVPVIGTRLAGIPDLVHHRETGMMSEPEDAKQLADCISELFTDKGLCQKIATNGRTLIETEYNLQKNVESLLHMMELAITSSQDQRNNPKK